MGAAALTSPFPSAVWTRGVPVLEPVVGAVTSQTHDPVADWDRVVDEIDAIQRLEADWDGAGAEPISVRVLDEAMFFVQRFKGHEGLAPSRTAPSPDGSIVFEWHLSDGYAEAEVAGSGTIEWMFQPRGEFTDYRSVTLVPSPSVGDVGCGAASDPSFETWFDGSREQATTSTA